MNLSIQWYIFLSIWQSLSQFIYTLFTKFCSTFLGTSHHHLILLKINQENLFNMLYDLKQCVHTFTWYCSHPVFGSDKTLFKIKTFRSLDTTFRTVTCISTHMDCFRFAMSVHIFSGNNKWKELDFSFFLVNLSMFVVGPGFIPLKLFISSGRRRSLHSARSAETL